MKWGHFSSFPTHGHVQYPTTTPSAPLPNFLCTTTQLLVSVPKCFRPPVLILAKTATYAVGYLRTYMYFIVFHIHAHIISCSFQHSNAYHSNKFAHFMNLQNPEPYLKNWLTNSSGSITPAWCHLIRRDLIVIRHHGTAHDGGMQVCCFNNEAKGVGWRRFSVPDLMGQRRADRADGTSQSNTENKMKPWHVYLWRANLANTCKHCLRQK